jgi:acyl transferase domain-containing protein
MKKQLDLAIIGMACRFAGANNYQTFWNNLKNGVNSIVEITKDRWDIEKYYSPNFDDKNKSISKWGGLIDNIYRFDSSFFGVSNREALCMDPQQRLLLEEAWHCIEDAGIKLATLQEKKTSVFAGVMSTDYQERTAISGDFDCYACLGNYECMLANRISHFMGLTGVSKSIDTACSSSLVALHDARQSLLLGESDYAFVGGVNIICNPMKYIAFSKSRMLSPDGQCKTFDKSANGYVPGEGVAILLVTTVKKALENDHRIHAIVKGSAVNHIGKSSSITAPKVEAQCEVIQAAQRAARVKPELITYIEAHGTGTSLGDPIEVSALHKAFNTARKQFCYIGSVKTNIGHCEAAAGMAGIIKTVLMLRHKQMVPTLNIKTINPLLSGLQNSPFLLARKATKWETASEQVRYAGVSSFGFGGVSAHVILKEHTEQNTKKENIAHAAMKLYPFVLSAKSAVSLERMVTNWQAYCKSPQCRGHSLANISHTLIYGRECFDYRLVAMVKNKKELLTKLVQFRLSDKTNVDDKKVFCVMGEFLKIKIKDFRSLMAFHAGLKKEYHSCCDWLIKIGAKQYVEEWSNNKNNTNQKLAHFVITYCLGRMLLKNIKQLKGVAGEGVGQLVSSVISQSVDLKEVLHMLCYPEKIRSIELKQPSIAMYDPILHKMLKPCMANTHISERLYLSTKKIKNIVLKQLKQVFGNIQDLIENQFTFKKHIQTWRDTVEQHNINWDKFFTPSSKHPVLLFIIIAVCLKKVNQKWNLPNTIIQVSTEFQEIVQLLIDNAITYMDIVKLYTTKNKNDKLINQLDNTKLDLSEKETKGWAKQFGETRFSSEDENHLLDSIQDCQFISMGCLSQELTSSFIALDSAESYLINDCLIKLWQNRLYDDIPTLFMGFHGRVIDLPGYPFLGDYYSIKAKKQENTLVANYSPKKAHPLIDENTSTLHEQCFVTTLKKETFYLRDHLIGDINLLPGAVTLELARAAGSISVRDKKIVSIANIFWEQPVVVSNEQKQIHINLYPSDAGIAFKITEMKGKNERDESKLHVRGRLILSDNALMEEQQSIEIINKLSSSCKKKLFKNDFYQELNNVGFSYGATFQNVEWTKIGDNEAISKLQLMEKLLKDNNRNAYMFHPALLDGGLQTALGISLLDNDSKMQLPFSVEQIDFFSALPDSCYVSVKRKEQNQHAATYDIVYFSKHGKIYMRFLNLVMRTVNKIGVRSQKRLALSYYKPCWIQSNFTIASKPTGPLESCAHLLTFIDDREFALALECELKTSKPDIIFIHVLSGDEYRKIDKNHYQIQPGNISCYAKLFKDLNTAYPEVKWTHIVNCWSEAHQVSAKTIESDLFRGSYHLLALSQSILESKVTKVRLLHIYPCVAEFLTIDDMNNGFVRTIKEEQPDYFYQLIGVDEVYSKPKKIAGIIVSEFIQGSDPQVRYKDGCRFINQFSSVKLDTVKSERINVVKKRGVYLITGGLGGLGIIFANHLAAHFQAKLILTGRSELDSKGQNLIDNIGELGGEAIYVSGNISRREDVKRIIEVGKERFGEFSGIIHAAGVLRDALISKKNFEEMSEVFSSKVYGTLHLDELTKSNKQLDCFVLFCSITGSLGNVGQSDYTCANSFMDSFAHYRNYLVAQNKRFGKTVAIDWPLWAEGGMQEDEITRKILLETFGVDTLGSKNGLAAFFDILHSDYTQILPIFGYQNKVKDILDRRSKYIIEKNLGRIKCDECIDISREKKIAYLKEVIATCLKQSKESIKENVPFEHYGIDSILIMDITRTLEKKFGPLPKTLFFEYQNLAELADYFIINYSKQFQTLFSNNYPALKQFNIADNLALEEANMQASARPRFLTKTKELNNNAQNQSQEETDIAIIGVAGRYPMANSLEEFWDNLKAGRDCIIEVPAERWDFHKYYNPDRKKQKTIYSKWGGFIDDFDKFDPLFFNISPREASLMDPQERLFLEMAWQAVENAGYSKDKLSSSVGVYVGVMYGQYQLYGADEMQKGNNLATNSFYSSIANRVSYYFNFQGPSLAVDTMCSSSLTSIHLACEGIKRGECEAALAGGVNVCSHPHKYLLLSQGQFLSTDGKCRSFGEGGDGYVPGEGVGVVLLKLLKQAQIDGDYIYGVIKSTSINHGGKTNGYTVPNPNAQAQLVKRAIQKANIDPRTVSYIEAHGTGTALGDPIELFGLSKAFSEHTQDKQFCSIGSVKSNIGHLESAAGVAALTKVLLQLKYGQLAPSIHSGVSNPNLDFKESPFYLQRNLTDWCRPSIIQDGEKILFPRRAGISSFGAGGSNAHIIIEEAPKRRTSVKEKPHYVVTLSAKTAKALHLRQKNLLEWLTQNENKFASLVSISYTLNVGRVHFNYRSAWVVSSRDELTKQIKALLDNKKTHLYFSGVAVDEAAMPDIDKYDALLCDIVSGQNNGRNDENWYFENLKTVANIYINGYKINWELLYDDARVWRIPLPNYPFERKRYWIKTRDKLATVPKFEDLNLPIIGAQMKNLGHNVHYNERGFLENVKESLKLIIKNVLFLEDEDLDIDKDFDQYGIDSILAVEVINKLNSKFKTTLQATTLYNYPTVRSLMEHIVKNKTSENERKINSNIVRSTAMATEPKKMIRAPGVLPTEACSQISKTQHSETKLVKLSNLSDMRGDGASTWNPEKEIEAIIKEVLFFENEHLDADKELAQYGVDSILAVEIVNKLNKVYKINLQAATLYSYPTLTSLSKRVSEMSSGFHDNRVKLTNKIKLINPIFSKDTKKRDLAYNDNSTKKQAISTEITPINLSTTKISANGSSIPASEKNEHIAIIGISLEMPGSETVSQFWENLLLGNNLITKIPGERWSLDSFYDINVDAKNKCVSKWGGFINNFDKFDPLFFNISPKEAAYMDPQQRLFLQHCWGALEDAGYTPENINSERCGVYVGVMNQDYNQLMAQKHSDILHYGVTGNSNSILAGRVAYYLNLRGPTITIDTACSSSLVAIHMAAQTLLNNEADVMFVGGVTLWLNPSSYVGMSQAGMLSSEGKCKTFDNSADGFVPGEGVGVILLKPLADAERDGDHIYGVIKGSGVNQDGRTNGITAPNGRSQASLEKEVYRRYRIDVENIGYVEAHGTATKLGDPIEVNALMDSFREFTSKKQFCAIGSVKSNIGHTAAAAGVAGVIKTLLCFQHGKLVPSLNFSVPNEHINFHESPFYVVKEQQEWKKVDNKPRMAAVSSFGFSGTNAHLILEEAPFQYNRIGSDSKPYYLVTLSAKSELAFKQRQKDLFNWLVNTNRKNSKFSRLPSISYTLNTGRQHFNYRGAWVVKNAEELKAELEATLSGKQSELCFIGITDNKKPDDNAIYEKVLAETIQELKELTLQDVDHYKKNLRALANLYVKGYSIDWGLLYQKEPKQRISLPTYPFAKERYWFPENREKNENDSASSREKFFLRKAWKQSALIRQITSFSSIIVYGKNTKKLAERLAENKANVLLVDSSKIRNYLQEDLTIYDSWIDLSAEKYNKSQLDWILLLQRLIESNKTGKLRLLYITQGSEAFLNPSINMCGTEKIALYRMLQSEYSTIVSCHIDLDPKDTDEKKLCDIIYNELSRQQKEIEICYRNNNRYVSILELIDDPVKRSNSVQFMDSQVLLITGGTKGLGALFAQHFVKNYGVRKVVLTGRENIPCKAKWDNMEKICGPVRAKVDRIKKLESMGVEVCVLSLPLDNLTVMREEFKRIESSMGPIVGVIHAAGLVDLDNPAFIHKAITGISSVLSPKIEGLQNLSRCIDKDNLKFMMLCSSASSIVPDFASGYSDYAMANTFMDYFALANHNYFPVVSVQWPSWKNTGFGKVTSKAYENSGLLGMSNQEGLGLLDTILCNFQQPVILPIIVNPDKFNLGNLLMSNINEQKKQGSITTKSPLSNTVQQTCNDSITNSIQQWLKKVFADELKLKNRDFDIETPFANYGVDSILLAQLVRQMSREFSIEIDTSILFEHPTIIALSHWLVKNHYREIFSYFKNRTFKPNSTMERITDNSKKENMSTNVIQNSRPFFHYSKPPETIAVVGMSCQFPGASTLDDYWDLLLHGKSAISEIPENCWGVQTNFYAGLLENIYNFDPEFFLISKEDAAIMDPQAILLLRESLKTIYHAGYRHKDIDGENIGVYIGGRGQYCLDNKLLATARNPIMAVGQNYLSANISQFYNINGPSLVIDTACSSALVAMDLAVEALQHGKIKSAFVGGVNLLTNPAAHQLFSNRGLLQKNGEFHILDQRASGIVLGEGVGMVYLKPLTLAEQDGDTVYATISSITVNNDGRTPGPASPNIETQKSVMKHALQRSNCQAQDVTYIEINGSGSVVTDLIEIKAVSSTYRTGIQNPCCLGSMKPNIGHPLCAEGIAAFIKVCLMLSHQTIVPFLSGQCPLTHFSLKEKNFILPRKPMSIYSPYAAINSFADGGTNVHAILRHYQPALASLGRVSITTPALDLVDVRGLGIT